VDYKNNMSKIDNKLEKIIRDTYSLGYNNEDENTNNYVTQIKHLILSEIKKVEPKKSPKYTFKEYQIGRNQGINEYHKALEELLK